MIILIEVFYPTEHLVSSNLKRSNREVFVRTGLTAYQISKLLLMQCRYLQTELHCLWMNHNNLGALNKIKQAGNRKQKRKNHWRHAHAMSEEFYTFFFLFKMVGYKNRFQNHNEKSTIHNGENIILLSYLTNKVTMGCLFLQLLKGNMCMASNRC